MNAAASPGFFRRWRTPILAFGTTAAIFATLLGTQTFEVLPEAEFPLMIAFQVALLTTLATMAIWFPFFSPLSRRTRVLVILILVASVGGWIACIKRVEFSGRMGLIVVYRWQTDPRDEVARHLAVAVPTKEGLSAGDVSVAVGDFPRYRGTKGDGVVADIPASAWKDKEFRLAWKQPIGGGYSGFVVAGKVLFTIEQRGDDEAIVCYNRDTHQEIWIHAYPAFFKQSEPMGGSGPRATPAVRDGLLYSLGGLGDLVCLDAVDGTLRWKRNILADNGAKNIAWGATASPLIVGDKVVVQPGVDPKNNVGKAIAAYDRRTGAPVWAKGQHGAGYGSPVLATLGGVELVLIFDGDGLAGIDPNDGTELWRAEWKTQFEMNTAQPLVLSGDRVFVSSEMSNGCALYKIVKGDAGWKADELWKTRSIAARFASPVARGELIFGLSNGLLTCVDAADGKRVWRDGRFGSGQLLLAGETLLIQAESGDVVAVAAAREGYRELGRLTVFSGKAWNTPAFARGKLYLRTHEFMACVETP